MLPDPLNETHRKLAHTCTYSVHTCIYLYAHTCVYCSTVIDVFITTCIEINCYSMCITLHCMLTDGCVGDDQEWNLGTGLNWHRDTLVDQVVEMSCR